MFLSIAIAMFINDLQAIYSTHRRHECLLLIRVKLDKPRSGGSLVIIIIIMEPNSGDNIDAPPYFSFISYNPITLNFHFRTLQ
jgi:hypothetical protein